MSRQFSAGAAEASSIFTNPRGASSPRSNGRRAANPARQEAPAPSELRVERRLEGAGDDVGLGLLDAGPHGLCLFDQIFRALLAPNRRQNEIDHAGPEARRQVPTLEVGTERLRHLIVARLAEIAHNER